MTCAVEVVRSRTVNIVSDVHIRAVVRHRFQVVFVSYRQMRVIRRRRDRAPLRADANPTRCRRCALNGQHQQEEDQNCAMNTGQHGGAKIITRKRPIRVASCDRVSSTEVPRDQKTILPVGQKSTHRLASPDLGFLDWWLPVRGALKRGKIKLTLADLLATLRRTGAWSPRLKMPVNVGVGDARPDSVHVRAPAVYGRVGDYAVRWHPKQFRGSADGVRHASGRVCVPAARVRVDDRDVQ